MSSLHMDLQAFVCDYAILIGRYKQWMEFLQNKIGDGNRYGYWQSAEPEN